MQRQLHSTLPERTSRFQAGWHARPRTGTVAALPLASATAPHLAPLKLLPLLAGFKLLVNSLQPLLLAPPRLQRREWWEAGVRTDSRVQRVGHVGQQHPAPSHVDLLHLPAPAPPNTTKPQQAPRARAPSLTARYMWNSPLPAPALLPMV